MSENKWKHRDEWRQRGRDFMVMVSRHTVSTVDYWEGPNRWAVYAYVYPKHPHFAKFEGPAMFQDAAAIMPLHAGASFLQWHRDDDGKPCSVQVGADYHHLDDDFTKYATKDEAYIVFADADNLFKWLTERADEPIPTNGTIHN
jgi:hypothetical protein